jgi:hypothetical protein
MREFSSATLPRKAATLASDSASEIFNCWNTGLVAAENRDPDCLAAALRIASISCFFCASSCAISRRVLCTSGCSSV